MGTCYCDRRNADTLKRLNDTEKKLKEKKEQEYVNLDLSNEEREKGNQVSRLLELPPLKRVALSVYN